MGCLRRRRWATTTAAAAVAVIAIVLPPADARATTVAVLSGSGPFQDGVLTVLDGATGQVTGTAAAAANPGPVVFDPFGNFVYAGSHTDCQVNRPAGSSCSTISQTQLSPLTTVSNTFVDPSHAHLEGAPEWEAMAPGGSTLYANTGDNTVMTLDVTHSPPSLAQAVFGTHSGPGDVVISPDGTTAWLNTDDVSNNSDETVYPFDLTQAPPAQGTKVDLGVSTGYGPMAFSPDGTKLYVTELGHYNSNLGQFDPSKLAVLSVTAPGVASVIGTINLGGNVVGLVMAPDGRTLYAIDGNTPGAGTTESPIEGVEVVDVSGDAGNDTVTATWQPPGAILQAGAIDPGGGTLYVTNGATSDGGSGVNNLLAVPLPITGAGPNGSVHAYAINNGAVTGVAVAPDQPVAAAFSSPGGETGTPVAFTSNSAPTDRIATYHWDFGDGSPAATTTTGSTTHTFASPCTCSVKLTVTTTGGTNTARVFDGHEVLRNGDATAAVTHTVTITQGTGPPPAPAVTLSANELDFPSVSPGQTTAAQTVTVTNSGTAPLHVSAGSATLAGSQKDAFQIVTDGCASQKVAIGAQCSVSVRFSPPTSGAFSAQLSLSDDSGDSPQTVTLKGTGLVGPLVSVNTHRLEFGAVRVGASATGTLTVTNAGQSPLAISRATLTSGPFTIATDACSGHAVAAGADCAIAVRFDPSDLGTFSATLILTDTAPDSPQQVAIAGLGETQSGGEIRGHIVRAGGAGGAVVPVEGASVYSCPQSALESASCQTATSAADGSYVLRSVPAVRTEVQVSPVQSDLFGASAIVTPASGTTITQDFTLGRPAPLGAGLSLNGQTSGIPTVFYTSPLTLKAPLPIATTAKPNSTRLFTGFAGVQDAPDGPPGSSSIQAAVILFAGYYGADGKLKGISDPALAPADCGRSAQQEAACEALAASSAHLPSSGARDVGSGGPKAHIAEIPGPSRVVVSQTLTPNQFGGVTITDKFSDGTTGTLELGQAQIPSLTGGNPWQNAIIDVGNAGLNVTPAGWYNSFVGAANQLATASQNASSNAADAAQNVASAAWQITTQVIGQKFHGAANLLWNLYTSEVNGAIDPHGPTGGGGTTGNGGQSSLWKDPSGTVRTAGHVPIAGARVVLLRRSGSNMKLTPVPNHSVVMSPGNRRNPDRTNVLGLYGWDVLPGTYEITAAHRGCRAAHGGTARSRLLPVPPAQTGIDLVLRCPHLRRTHATLTLRIGRPGNGRYGTRIIRAVVTARHHAHPQGTITFLAGRRRLAVVALDVRTDTAMLSIPVIARVGHRLTAVYGGDGLRAGAQASARF